MNSELKPWSIDSAVNLPEHSNNPIHTDAGARAAGHPSALVAGVSVYAWLTHPPAAAWGEAWLRSGGGELRLKKPVFDKARVDCRIEANTTVIANSGGEACATFEVWQEAEAPAMRSGEKLATKEFSLEEALANYGVRCGDDLSLYNESDFAHPAVWPNLANTIFTEQLVSGAWIHTRSRIFHQGLARAGDAMRIESTVIDRFATRAGKRAVVDMQMFANDQPVLRIEHEALVELTDS